MTKQVLLYFALLLWFVVPVMAQPTIFTEDLSVDTNQKIEVDVKVADFTEILSMQFSVNWTPSVLQFDSVSVNVDALPDYSAASGFGTSSTSSGKLSTSWFDPALAGVTLASNTSIFTIHFTVLGLSGSDSEVQITGDPVMIEVSNTDSEILDVNTENGTVSVLSSTGINELLVQSNKNFTLFQNEPNPFDNQTVISFDVHEPSNFVLEVYDTKGTLIHTQNAHYLKGIQSITIEKEILPTVGAYFYKLKTKDYFITNRMILVSK